MPVQQSLIFANRMDAGEVLASRTRAGSGTLHCAARPPLDRAQVAPHCHARCLMTYHLRGISAMPSTLSGEASVRLAASPTRPVKARPNTPRERRTVRALLPVTLSPDEISALLHAGFAVDRAACWGRGAIPAQHCSDVTIYAVTPDATYRYDQRAVCLETLSTGDLRTSSRPSQSTATAPLQLVYVVALDARQRTQTEEHGTDPGADIGRVVENIYTYCARTGLASVIASRIDRSLAAAGLGLKRSQHIALVQAIGRGASGCRQTKEGLCMSSSQGDDHA